MAIVKVVMFFRDQGGHGWSELFYRVANDAPDAFTVARNLQNKRRAVLNSAFAIPYIRTSVLGRPRDAAFEAFPFEDSQGLLTQTLPAVGPQYYDAVNCRLFSGSTNWRSYLIRAISSGIANADGSLNRTSLAYAPLLTYLSYLSNGTFSILSTSKSATLAVTAIQSSPDKRTLTLTVAAGPPSVVTGNTILLSNVTDIAGVAGRHVVRNVNGTSVLLERMRKPYVGEIDNLARTSYLQVITFSTANINNATAVAGTWKATGRPSYVRPGRRSRQTQ